MSLFGTENTPAAQQNLLGLDETQGNTDQEARPVPVILGTPSPIAPTLLTNRFNVYHVSHSSKKAGETREYYCSIAGLLCQGPVDRLVKILVDRVEAWPMGGQPITRSKVKNKLVMVKVLNGGSGYTTGTTITVSNGAVVNPIVREGKIVDMIVDQQGADCDPNNPPAIMADIGIGAEFAAVIDSETFIAITVPGYGVLRFYWGTENTEYDPTLLGLSSDNGRNPGGLTNDNAAEEHPAYQGQCKFVAINWRLGQNRTNFQNIEFVLSKFPETTLETTQANVNWDCNVPVVVADWLTNTRYGLGMDPAVYNQANFDDIATLLAGDGLAVSPLVTTSEAFGNQLVRLMEYVNGYHTMNRDGELILGLIRDPGCVVEDPSTPYLDEKALTEPPRLNPISWDDTVNQVYVTYTDRAVNYKARSVSANNRANWKITGEPKKVTVQRPWFTDMAVADGYARGYAQIEGSPKAGGVLTARESKVAGLQVGGIFKLNWAHWQLCYQFCRVVEMRRTRPYDREVEITFEKDRGYLVARTTQVPVYTPPTKKVYDPMTPLAFRFIELPYLHEYPKQPYIAALVARNDPVTSGFSTYRTDPGGNAVPLLKSNALAYYGRLAVDYGRADDGNVTVIMEGHDTTLPSRILSATGSSSDEWIMVIGDEFFSVRIAYVSDLSTHEYICEVLRERFDSKRGDYEAGTPVWIIEKSAMARSMFTTGLDSSAGQTVTLKIETTTFGKNLDPASWPSQSITWTNRCNRYWKPRNLRVNGTLWYEGPAYHTGNSITLQWDLVNRDGTTWWEDNMTSLWTVEIRNSGGTVVATYRYAATTSGAVISNATLQALLGGQTNFSVRIYAEQVDQGAGVTSSVYDQADVTFS